MNQQLSLCNQMWCVLTLAGIQLFLVGMVIASWIYALRLQEKLDAVETLKQRLEASHLVALEQYATLLKIHHKLIRDPELTNEEKMRRVMETTSYMSSSVVSSLELMCSAYGKPLPPVWYQIHELLSLPPVRQGHDSNGIRQDVDAHRDSSKNFAD